MYLSENIQVFDLFLTGLFIQLLGDIPRTMSEAIATVAVLVSIGLFIWARNHRRPDMRRDELEGALSSVLKMLKETTIFSIHPFQEVWDHGFPRLKELRGLLAAASVAAESCRDTPPELQIILKEVLDRIRTLTILYDGFKDHKTGRESEPRRAVQEDWPDLKTAQAQLKALQNPIKDLMSNIESFREKN